MSWPLCVKYIFNQEKYVVTAHLRKNYGESQRAHRPLSDEHRFTIRPRDQCRLRWYTIDDVVSCFTEKTTITNNNGVPPSPSSILNKKKSLHIVFMGDSRIRQQFLNFLKVSL